MANGLDQDQARRNVGPDLDPNRLQRVSADDTNSQRVEWIDHGVTGARPIMH